LKRHNLLVTPYIERALWLADHLNGQGIAAKVVTRHAVQVDPEQAERAFELGLRFIDEQNSKAMRASVGAGQVPAVEVLSGAAAVVPPAS
jgi:hypothetical protein